MTRTRRLLLLTLGDPERLSGGYLYHQRLAEAAPGHGFEIGFAGLADPWRPGAGGEARRVVREAERRADALLLDSIVAARCAAALALPRRRPLVAIAHQPPGGMDAGPLRRIVGRWLDLAAYRRADRVVAASAALREELVAAGLERVEVVAPGRDPAPAAAAAGDLRQGRRAAVLCVANWQPRKDVLSLLEALARLPAGAATLHLAGDEDADPAYGRRVRRRLAGPDLAGRVVRHGRLTSTEVAALYAGADVFALPSLVEPYGTVYGEAMAAGLPCVGWHAGNLPNLAQPGRECLTVPPGDVAGLAAALAELCLDEERRIRIGEAAARRARELPTWGESARRFFAIVHAALDT
jgi:glycosyltransferase involved in cell wall biosynthesis